jgi:ClpP class serine protease
MRLDAATAAAGPRRGARTMGSVGVIPIYGLIMPRANLMTEMSGGTTLTDIRASFRQALEDESIGSILFDIDSPGGVADGIEELATEIRDARGRKPMVSIANYGMASAALYLGAQADEIVASPSSFVGWIGTVTWHTEFSKADEMAGVKTTIIRDPAGKYGANEFEPISEKALADLTQQVGDLSAQFHSAMAKGRNVSVATVKADFGQGGGMIAARAKAVGLVDRVETFDATVRRLASGRGPVSRGTTSIGGQLYQVEPILTATLVHADGTEADADGMFTLESDGEGESLPSIEPTEGGDAEPADDPGADASGEAGTPPDVDEIPAPTDDAVALELAQAKHRHHTR